MRAHLLLATSFLSLSVFAVPREEPTFNPSLSLLFGSGPTPSESGLTHACQGNVILRERSRPGWICTVLTAAHCIVNASGDKPTFLKIVGRGFAPIESIVAKNLDFRNADDDIAVFRIRSQCDSLEANLVPLHDGPLPRTSDGVIPLYYASRMFGKLHKGTARFSSAQGSKSFFLIADDGSAIFGGDSGGGAYLLNEKTGKLEIVAIVTAGVVSATSWAELKAKEEQHVGSIRIGASADLEWVRGQMVTRAMTAVPETPAAAPDKLDELGALLTPTKRR